MNSKLLIFGLAITFGLFSCVSKEKKNENADPGVHEVTVNEVIQANAYTYLNVNEDGKDFWIAVSKMDASEGEVYYYENAMEMTNFESKDLQRTFETIYFIQSISKTPVGHASQQHSHAGHDHNHNHPEHGEMEQQHSGKPNIAKTEISVEPAENGVTVAEIYANKARNNNKEFIVRGKVVKVNYGIMHKNWFHIQDGTDHNGDFDLTVTSLAEDIEVGDVVTFKGLLAVDKDFGYGYKYDVILEDATRLE